MYYGHVHNRVAEIRKERSLIIDPGARTFDRLVTQGMQLVEKKSHSVNRGMFDVLQAIASGISKATGILDGLIRAVAIDSITRPLEFRPPEEAAAQGRGFGKTRSGAVPKKKPRIRIGALRLYPSGGGERYRVAPVHLQGPCQDGRQASTLIFKGSQLKTPILAREMRQDCAPCTVTRSKNEQAKLSASARKIAGDA